MAYKQSETRERAIAHYTEQCISMLNGNKGYRTLHNQEWVASKKNPPDYTELKKRLKVFFEKDAEKLERRRLKKGGKPLV